MNAPPAPQPPHDRQEPTPRRWPRRLRRAAVACLCLAVTVYVGWKIWQWAAVPKNAPVVGASFDTAWHAAVGITTKNYEIALTRAGARLVEIQPDDGSPDAILDSIDGLLLTGGGDVDPALYGGNPADAQLVDRERDDFELALIRGALDRDMPILGICRGIQILNVAQGGTLRNLRDDPELAETHGIEVDSFDAHDVTISEGSKLAQLIGPGGRSVNSFHGQAVDRLGEGLTVSATAPDGMVEALEIPGQTFVLTTQFHPEIPPAEMRVFEAFLEAAKEYRDRAGP